MANLVLIFSSLLMLSAVQGIFAVTYTVTNTAANTAGGARFVRDIGVQYTLQTMDASTAFIWRTFQQNTATDRKTVQGVSLFIDDMGGVAYTSNDQIHVSSRYIYLSFSKTSSSIFLY